MLNTVGLFLRPGLVRRWLVLLTLAMAGTVSAQAVDSLPSWHDTGAKDFVAPADRIAVFDNDGTLWSEQPMYFQLAFALDRVKALAPKHPEWKTSAPGARLGLIVHHDHAQREYAYDRKSPIGKLDRGLDEADKRGWIIVSMKNDWKMIYEAMAASAGSTNR